MHEERVVVLKFGASVLVDEAAIPGAVHEIYRWRRAGWRVVAVASALLGTTESLLARAHAAVADPDPFSVAALTATGEHASAAMLGLALDRAGLVATVIDDRSLGLRAVGDPLNATPVDVDLGALRDALARASVVVVPGFVGRDEQQRTVLFGRGGSDLTAVFLASRLGARCRLLKDVDGIYEWDPRRPGPSPRRYTTLDFEDAGAIDDAVVQRKAVRLARRANCEVEVGALYSNHVTRIGTARSRVGAALRGNRAHRVVVLGAGTVGGGVASALRRQPERFEVVAVGAREAGTRPDGLVVTDVPSALRHECDTVVECIGGIEPARGAITAALAAGRSVVTANKAVIAAHGRELMDAAARSGVGLRWSAAVGGGVPVLETARRLARTGRIESVEAVLNGTANFVLDRVATGGTLTAALREAVECGFAEGDGARDLDGRDAADKAALVIDAITGRSVDARRVARTPITEASLASVARPGAVVRQMVTIDFRASGVRASVDLRALDPAHPLATIRCEHNAALFRRIDGRCTSVAGRGAGRWPTTEAIVADLLDLLVGAADRRPVKGVTRVA